MKVNTDAIDELLSPLKQYFQKDNFTRDDVISKPPLRSELLTAEQMEQYAQQLAAHHSVTTAQAPEKLLKRLAENEEIIFRVTTLLHEAVREKRTVTPAGEWLLDNFYLIEEEIKTGKRYLPKGYSKGLPKLKSGPQEGYPRVYDIAIEIISHSDGHVDIGSLSRFIAAYQKVTQLTIGELWAIPIMLRLALLENLRRVAARIAVDRIDAALANHWANLIIDTSEHNPKDLVIVIADMARSKPPMVSAFVAEFARKLQWKGNDLKLPLNWIEQHLSGTSHTINSMVLSENQQQAADQLSVSNSINSLRFLSKMDWREFVETMSVVEQTLRMDEHYPLMDFQTRDYYRHQVEAIAKHSNRTENDVARIALDLSRREREQSSPDPRTHHVGYFLVDRGRKITEQASAVSRALPERIRHNMAQYKSFLYFAGIFAITASVTYLGYTLLPPDLRTGVIAVLLVIMFLFTSSQFAVALINWLSTILVPPKPLPRLDFSRGVPPEFTTLVAVPTLLLGKEQCDKLIRDLEVRFLANRDPHIFFALLTDFRDAPTQHMPDDDALIARLKKRINDLNERYSTDNHRPFLLFHRPRVLNRQDKTWMGYERKRGKLAELNRALRGLDKEKFSVIIGDERDYHSVKFVITLDSDTLLPREVASKLAGIMAHPLNRPAVDEKTLRVTKGYGVIQPRVAISLHGSARSRYSVLNESDSGIDPYTQVTSDVYQDVFQEGSFIGKGIYDVDCFEKVLSNRFPANRILSHDLLEGSYIRSGFASDVQLYEAYPERYQQDIARRHRWIRGDWQIAAWAMPWVPDSAKKRVSNPISFLSRWKVFDNLRRSFVPVALTIQFVLGWTLLTPVWLWTLFTLGLVLLPSAVNTVRGALRKPKEIKFRQHLSNTVGATHKTILQSLFAIACLPFEAYSSLSAILVTFWRMHINKKKLLEWSPSSAHDKSKDSLRGSFRKMWIAPVVSILVLALISRVYPQSLIWSLPFLFAWFTSPVISCIISLRKKAIKVTLDESEKKLLRRLARKTWAFFEQHVTSAENWLPPDNLQQYPVAVIAHRTSPTNIGMALLANLAAHDFGWLSIKRLLERTENTFTTMARLERYRGHFYNWYDTQSLVVLKPAYISSVDSGNLAGHLLTLRQGLAELIHHKVVDEQTLSGLTDTLEMIGSVLSKQEQVGFRQFEETFKENIPRAPLTLAAVKDFVDNVITSFEHLVKPDLFDPNTEAGAWVHSFTQQLTDINEEIERVAPWISLDLAPSRLSDLVDYDEIPSTGSVISGEARWNLMLRSARESTPLTNDENKWLNRLDDVRTAAVARARERLSLAVRLMEQCVEFANIEYNFLYDKSQRLISIGYSVDDRRLDTSYYDLLASEARLSNFVAIAQGKLPEESWFALGRRLTSNARSQVLLSWSGSMFEYLMPMLVMPSYENTLLDETCHSVVDRQIEYGSQQDVPWGISESCYNLVDGALNYQYRAFGVPGLGFKRGLGQDLVISPYASVMALMVSPSEALENIIRLQREGFEGRYGLYEAIDYTPGRLSRGQRMALIKTFMAHHQGMSLLSLAYVLLDRPMQRRFEADPNFQSSLLLLQEQIPKTISHYESIGDTEEVLPSLQSAEIRIIKTADTSIPEVQLLSNGRYHVMVTNSGGGYSKWNETAVTRWREDTTCDNWGTFCYVRDVETGLYWSTGFQPTLQTPRAYEAIFSQGRVEFRRRDNDIETYTEVIVSPEDDIEVRRVHLINHSRAVRQIELTSYAEVVIALPGADDSHPAFSNLFVQTEINKNQNAITCTRRPRSKDEQPPWMFHLMKVNGAPTGEPTYETNRSNFIGRGRSVRNPQSIERGRGLSGMQGPVLDPIVAIQYTISLGPGETATIDMITGISLTKEGNQALIDRYQDKHLRDRAFELSWTHSQVVLRQIGATEADAQLFGKMASSVIYLNPSLRAIPSTIMKNQKGQSALWSYSISGDLPIVLLQVSDSSNVTIIKQMILAQAYWHLKGLAVDLIILNEDPSGYRQLLQDQINGLIAADVGISGTEKRGRIFVRSVDQVSTEDLVLFQTVARVIITDLKGSLSDQINKRTTPKSTTPLMLPSRTSAEESGRVAPVTDLEFFNGTGGFSKEGNEYVINLGAFKQTPLPWVNVIANKFFGTIATESGPGYTWFENAHEYRLTPWHNDPVSNASGEAFYLRDDETGKHWSPTPLPCDGSSTYVVRHGFGFTTYQHEEEGILSELTIYVDLDDPVKFSVLKLTNRSGRKRKLSAYAYAEWVLGGLRPRTQMHVVTERDPSTGALTARNSYNQEFYNRTAFLDTDDLQIHFTSSRTEFIGRNGSLSRPDALSRVRLSGAAGASNDPAVAMQVPLELEGGHNRQVIFRMGAGRDVREADEVIRRSKGSAAAQKSLERVREFWSRTLGAVRVETPDKSINLLANGWLLYQTLSCRLWGRSGFYQSGGAYGFRDQLQDVLAVLHASPSLTREQILVSASRQFREGDVQHWWHPPLGRGVRTLCSDDMLWLPYVVSRYINVTHDHKILDEQISFLQGRQLNQNEESYYDLPIVSDQRASLYDHCKRAIQRALKTGPHGLPLMGSGDWNDGMNMVGIHGTGESVWLAFFLFDVLKRFQAIALERGDNSFADAYDQKATELQVNINEHAWDGEWYLRGWFDDGSTLGSHLNDECSIDSISQSWAMISGAGEPGKVETALASIDQKLVNREKKLIQLLDPPFDKSEMDPGYIKGYVPGVRENGGQYTHAAIWMVMAFARRGDWAKTMEFFNLINPVHHGSSSELISLYKAEPYVVAADVYGVPPHTGRGGWTWYTGSAGWMYQLVIESILGITREGNALRFNPCVPPSWKTFEVKYRFQDTTYHIVVDVSVEGESASLTVDDELLSEMMLPLNNDKKEHRVTVKVGTGAHQHQARVEDAR